MSSLWGTVSMGAIWLVCLAKRKFRMWRWIWMETVRREARHGVPIYYGDGSNANVLRHMKIEDAKVLVVALSDPFTARRTVKVAKG